MSVFTHIDEALLREYLARFDVGKLVSFQGIESGIENTNYLIDTDRGRCVLTLVEQYNFRRSRWFVDLVEFIATQGFPVPQPIADFSGVSLIMLSYRPAVLTPFIDGAPVDSVTEDIVLQLGECLGRLHKITLGYTQKHPLFRDVHWCRRQLSQIAEHISGDQRALIASELETQLVAQAEKLPIGAVHADVFRDNVFFVDGKLNGVIDFWHSGIDSLLYDLAIACNDWCWDGKEFHTGLLRALLQGYSRQRRLTEAENRQWQLSLRRAALRFWLSRLTDTYLARSGLITHQKNPEEQQRLLEFLRSNDVPGPEQLLGQA